MGNSAEAGHPLLFRKTLDLHSGPRPTVKIPPLQITPRRKPASPAAWQPDASVQG